MTSAQRAFLFDLSSFLCVDTLTRHQYMIGAILTAYRRYVLFILLICDRFFIKLISSLNHLNPNVVLDLTKVVFTLYNYTSLKQQYITAIKR